MWLIWSWGKFFHYFFKKSKTKIEQNERAAIAVYRTYLAFLLPAIPSSHITGRFVHPPA
jgi:hypothetical protein